MRITIKKRVVFQTFRIGLMSLGLAAMMAACAMPEKPQGYDDSNMTNIGNRMRAAGDDEGAANIYQRAIDANPNDIDARKALAEIFAAHGDAAAAVLQYRQALTVKPDDADLLRALGRLYLKQGQFADARDAYEKALHADSDDVKSLNGLGIALDNLGQHDAAQKTYLEALDDKPDDLVTLNNLAHSYVLVGAYDQAIALLEPHVKDKTATPAMRQNLAEAYGMNGMFVDAERMGRMDLTADQVKHNLDYYHARRAKLAPGPALYADLGTFPTGGLADATADDVKRTFPDETDGLIVESKSEIKAIGGTPVFSVMVTGFANAQKLRVFCEKLQQRQIACKAHGG